MVIAIISDVHSNLEALEIVLRKIKDSDLILNAGDLVGYNANPNEVLQILREQGVVSVQGNHDLASVIMDVSGLNPYAAKAIFWTFENLSQENKKYLKNLPQIYSKKVDGKTIVMVHGSPRNCLNDYVFPSTSENVLKMFLDQTKADILIMGHTHMPFIKKFSKKLVINTGSVGQPRDGDTRTCYILLDIKKLRARIFRIEYDFRPTQEKIIKAGLPRFLAERLGEGL